MYVFRLSCHGDYKLPDGTKARAVKGNLCSYPRTSRFDAGCGLYDLDALPSHAVVVFIATQRNVDALRESIRRRELAPWRVPVVRGKVVKHFVRVCRRMRVTDYVGRPPQDATDEEVAAWERLERPSFDEDDGSTARLAHIHDDYYDVPDALWAASTVAATTDAEAERMQSEFDAASRGYVPDLRDDADTHVARLRRVQNERELFDAFTMFPVADEGHLDEMLTRTGSSGCDELVQKAVARSSEARALDGDDASIQIATSDAERELLDALVECCSRRRLANAGTIASSPPAGKAPSSSTPTATGPRAAGAEEAPGAPVVVVAQVEVGANVNNDARRIDLVRASAVRYRPRPGRQGTGGSGGGGGADRGSVLPDIALVQTYDQEHPLSEYKNPGLHTSFAVSLFPLGCGGAGVPVAIDGFGRNAATFATGSVTDDDGGAAEANARADLRGADAAAAAAATKTDKAAAAVAYNLCEESLRILLVQRGAARFVGISLEVRQARFLRHVSRLYGRHASWMAKEFNLLMKHRIIANAKWKINSVFLEGDVNKAIETLKAASEGDPAARRAQFLLSNAAYAVTRNVLGTPQHRESFRDVIHGYGLTFGPATVFWTVNPAPKHDVRALRMADGSTRIIFDSPHLWPNATQRATMMADDPVTSALYYERVIKFYADAFLQFPWDAEHARGPGVVGVCTAEVGLTEMQGRGDNHFHGEAHTSMTFEALQGWLRDDTKRRAFFDYVDSSLCAELPPGLKGAHCDALGYPRLDDDWKLRHTIAVGRDARSRSRATGHRSRTGSPRRDA
jgi:hypothetical protein